MKFFSSYVRLMRLNKPIGILLLWCPTAWALWDANHGHPSLQLVMIFLTGTVLMRSAGCIINDIADRHIDIHVQRTRSRPLTTGEVSLSNAICLLFVLLSTALATLLYLPPQCFLWALIALLITSVYPFCKRYIKAPQVILGFAFSMGIPMAYCASGKDYNRNEFIILLINFFWILAYDTMYAMVDREDDLKIGVKSTAILFGDLDRLIVGIVLVFTHFFWLFYATVALVHALFYVLWLTAVPLLIYQLKLIWTRTPSLCFRSFSLSAYYGMIMWLAIILYWWY